MIGFWKDWYLIKVSNVNIDRPYSVYLPQSVPLFCNFSTIYKSIWPNCFSCVIKCHFFNINWGQNEPTFLWEHPFFLFAEQQLTSNASVRRMYGLVDEYMIHLSALKMVSTSRQVIDNWGREKKQAPILRLFINVRQLNPVCKVGLKPVFMLKKKKIKILPLLNQNELQFQKGLCFKVCLQVS